MAARPRSENGFTLIELMVVVVIIAVMLGAGAPALTGYISKYRAEADAKLFASEVTLARMKAISTNTRHRMTFDSAAQKIVVDTVDASGNHIADVSTINISPEVVLGRNTTNPLPNSSNASTGGAAAFGANSVDNIIFLPSGIANMGGEFFVIPKSDYKTGGDIHNIRAVQVSLVGMVRKFRNKLIDPAGAKNQTSNTQWVEY